MHLTTILKKKKFKQFLLVFLFKKFVYFTVGYGDICVCVCVEKWLNTQNVDLKMNNNDDEFIQIIV